MVTSVEASLRALQTDRIDVLLIHRPDLLLDPEEPGETFRYLKASGRVLQVGVSNHSPAQFEIVRKCHPLVTNQIEFSPLQMGALEDGTLEQCVDLGLRPMAWSPFRTREIDRGRGRTGAARARCSRRFGPALLRFGSDHGVRLDLAPSSAADSHHGIRPHRKPCAKQYAHCKFRSTLRTGTASGGRAPVAIYHERVLWHWKARSKALPQAQIYMRGRESGSTAVRSSTIRDLPYPAIELGDCCQP